MEKWRERGEEGRETLAKCKNFCKLSSTLISAASSVKLSKFCFSNWQNLVGGLPGAGVCRSDSYLVQGFTQIGTGNGGGQHFPVCVCRLTWQPHLSLALSLAAYYTYLIELQTNQSCNRYSKDEKPIGKQQIYNLNCL